MSRRLKRLFCFLLYVCGITPWLFRRLLRLQNAGLVLLYHHIRNPQSPFDPAVPADEFERHMQFAKKHFDLLPAQEFFRRAQTGICGPKLPALISFDDGYRDNLKVAYPVLKKYEIPAIIFLATESVGTGEPIWTSRVDRLFHQTSAASLSLENLPGKRSFELGDSYQRQKVCYTIKKEMKDVPDAQRQVILQELEEKIGVSDSTGEESEMLTWEDVRSLLQDPQMEVGSHTVTHRMLDQLSPEEIREELFDSKAKIEAETGRKIAFLSYPGNGYNSRVLETAEQAGYEAAFVVDHDLTYFSQDRFALKRLHVQNEPIYVLMAEITGVLSAVRNWVAGFKCKGAKK